MLYLSWHPVSLGEGYAVRSWCRHARVGPVVALVLVAGLLAAACGGSGGSSGGDASGSGGSAAVTGDSTQQGGASGGGGSQGGGGGQGGGSQGGAGQGGAGSAGGGSQGGGGGGQGEELAWVPFGPSDPTFPTPSWPIYRAFANGDCSALQDYLNSPEGESVDGFGQAMVAVCQAAVEGRQDRWEAAKTAAGADPSKLANDCLAAVVKDLLDRALAWHERHPGAKPTVRFQRLTGQTECGRQDSSESTEETIPESGSTADTGSSSSDTTADTSTGST
jgi:hypothetical protein